jgi:hypothetical protein
VIMDEVFIHENLEFAFIAPWNTAAVWREKKTRHHQHGRPAQSLISCLKLLLCISNPINLFCEICKVVQDQLLTH